MRYIFSLHIFIIYLIKDQNNLPNLREKTKIVYFVIICRNTYFIKTKINIKIERNQLKKRNLSSRLARFCNSVFQVYFIKTTNKKNENKNKTKKNQLKK